MTCSLLRASVPMRSRGMSGAAVVVAMGWVIGTIAPYPCRAADDAASDRRFRPLDVFELEHASDPQVSPDGKRVAYVRNFFDVQTDKARSNLWLVGTDGSDHRPLTTGSGNDGSPRWSPDGRRLAYVAQTDSGAQLHVRWMDTGQTAQVTRLPSAPSHLTWSPDGRTLAFAMLVRDEPEKFVELPPKPPGATWADPPKFIRKVLYRQDGEGYLPDGYPHLFVVPAEGGSPRQLTFGPFRDNGPLAWTPDAKAIVFSANREPGWERRPRRSDVHVVTVEDRSLVALTAGPGPCLAPVVSPDGTQIAYAGFVDRKKAYHVPALWVMDRDGKNARMLTERLDRDVRDPVWAADGQGLFFLFDDRGDTKVGRADLAGRTQVVGEGVGGTSLGRPYASGSFSVAKDGTVAWTRCDGQHPAEVAVARGTPQSTRVLTGLNEDLLGHKQLGTVQEFPVKSSFDGRAIQAWLIEPPEADPRKRHPLILEIHGGPFANYGPRFSIEFQTYAAAGYYVLYVNPRGSTGYGEEFGNLIHHAYPDRDYDDLMSAVDAVVARGFVDPDRLFVTGGSGGGVLTSWIVGHTNRFRAAVAVNPVINWYSFVLTSDMYPYFDQYWFPGHPWDHAEHYLKRSPISSAGKVSTPTMLYVGEADHRTPISESEQFFQALQLRGIDTALVRVPHASHNLTARPSLTIAKSAYVLKWFERHSGAKGK